MGSRLRSTTPIPRTSKHPTSGTVAEDQPLRILLVDDEQSAFLMTQAMLGSLEALSDHPRLGCDLRRGASTSP